jgi:hypothetical protein
MKPVPLLVTIAGAILMSACHKSPTAPGGSASYEGQWSGTTSQGRPIAFTVSSAQKVTAISIGYSFNGCAGTNTFSNLNLDIGNPPNPGSPSLGPSFGYGSGPPDGANYTQILGSFGSTTAATGSMTFGAYSGCGTAIGIWTAARR